MKRLYGDNPIQLGTFDVPEKYGTYLLYLPLKLKGQQFLTFPAGTEDLRSIVNLCIRNYGDVTNKYVYLSYETSYVLEGKTQKRPGWHSDGFLTDDINYIWYSDFPTEFSKTRFRVDNDHIRAMEAFEEQAKPEDSYTIPTKTLIRMDQFVIHRASVPPRNGMRTFLKISISDDKYNLVGNTKNPNLDYNWKMFERSLVRNHPQHKESDSFPEN